MTDKAVFSGHTDEMLETFWELREKNDLSRNALVREISRDGLEVLESSGLMTWDAETPHLSEQAEARARDIVRRHRLAERLFRDVLDLSNFEEDACTFEHVISPDVEEALCTFLGHPPTCPHGRPIPKGPCCSALSKKVCPLFSSIAHLEVGSEAKVAFLKSDHVDKLTHMGLGPGSTVRLIQKRPSVVIQVEETTLALDSEIALGVFVKATS